MVDCEKCCRNEHPFHPKTWCADCQAENAAKWDELAEQHEREVGYERTRDYHPASESEWRRRLDEVAPRA